MIKQPPKHQQINFASKRFARAWLEPEVMAWLAHHKPTRCLKEPPQISPAERTTVQEAMRKAGLIQ